jgi:hypothetical protein
LTSYSTTCRAVSLHCYSYSSITTTSTPLLHYYIIPDPSLLTSPLGSGTHAQHLQTPQPINTHHAISQPAAANPTLSCLIEPEVVPSAPSHRTFFQTTHYLPTLLHSNNNRHTTLTSLTTALQSTNTKQLLQPRSYCCIQHSATALPISALLSAVPGTALPYISPTSRRTLPAVAPSGSLPSPGNSSTARLKLALPSERGKELPACPAAVTLGGRELPVYPRAFSPSSSSLCYYSGPVLR